MRNDPNKRYKDDPSIIKTQVDKYFQEGYPRENGLIVIDGVYEGVMNDLKRCGNHDGKVVGRNKVWK